jgi:Tfp pilus assembly protein PilV
VRSIDPDKPSCPARLRARLAAACAAGRSRLRAERGSMLIEVMVGAVVLAIATVALLDGLDGAQSTGARNKARSVAATLAEQDQERMRALPVLRLVDSIGTPTTRTVTVRNVNYSVTSIASWAPDNGGVISCSNNTRTASNVRIVSEVTSAATRGVVDEASLVTPPAGTVAEGLGRAIVKITDRNQAVTPGVPITLNGPSSYSATTNALGCAIFSFIPVGNYTASVGGLLVDWQGNRPATKTLSVEEGQSSTTPFEVASPAQLQASFDTKIGAATAIAARSQFLTILNSKLTVGQKTIEASPAGAPGLLITAIDLFPFLDGYDAYAGKCPTNNPATLPNTGTLPRFTPTPGQVLATNPKIRVPAINLRVVQVNGTTVQAGAVVTVKTADGCAMTFPTQSSNTATPTAPLTAGGLPQPGFPYGTYRICAQATVSGQLRHGHADRRTGTGTGIYDAKSTNAYQTETAANLVDDPIPNTNPNGNATADNQNGAIRVRLNRQGACH